MPEQRGASMRPSSFTNASKFTDIDVEFQNVRFGEGTYADGTATAALLADLVDIDDGSSHNQFWSIGGVAAWTASDDGTEILPTKDGGTIKKSCNFAMLMDSLVKAGFPEDKLENSHSLNGLRVHIGAKAVQDSNAKNGTREVPVVEKILPNGLPWEASKRKGKAKAAAASASTGAPTTTTASSAPEALSGTGVDDDTKALVATAIITILSENGGSLERKKVNAAVSKLISAPANKETYPAASRGKIIAAIQKEEVLKGLDGVSYDGAVLKLAE